jgi:hypothetical protein
VISVNKEKQDYIENIRKELRDLDSELVRLKDSADEDKKDSYEVKELEERRADIDDRLEDAEEVAEKSWSDFKDELDSTYREFKRGFNDFIDTMRK